MEETFVAFARLARSRGHEVHLLGRPPVHPWVSQALADCGARWTELDDVERSFAGGVQWFRAHADVLIYTLLPLRGPLALRAAAAWPVRMVYWDETSWPSGGRRPAGLRRLATRAMAARLDAYLCCSRYVQQRGPEFVGIDLSAQRVVYNGVNLARFVPRRERAPGAPRVMTVVNLIRDKGVDTLIAAFAQVGGRDARLMIVGTGPELAALQAQAAALGVADRVDFLGLRDDVDRLLQQVDVFVHPARWDEAFGYSVAEAMASGLPVVGTARGALRELIEDGVTGCLVPADDPAAMARAIAGLLDDPARAARLGAAARAKAVRDFDHERAVEGMLEVVEAAGRR